MFLRREICVESPDSAKLRSPSCQLDGSVGVANLPDQVRRKSVKEGLEFSLMVVGETGLGKSTLINSVFLTEVYSSFHPGPSHQPRKTIAIETNKICLEEGGVNILLTLVDTPGFADALDNSSCWKPVLAYVEAQYEAFFEAESKVKRIPNMSDSRVHACLYFISPGRTELLLGL